MRARAPQRARKPSSTESPPKNSKTMAPTSSSAVAGMPYWAMYCCVPPKSAILPEADRRKMSAIRTRPRRGR